MSGGGSVDAPSLERWKRMALRSVRTARHKLILWKDPQKKPELYDLAADPGEEKNLIDAPEEQAVRKDPGARLRAWMEDGGPVGPHPRPLSHPPPPDRARGATTLPKTRRLSYLSPLSRSGGGGWERGQGG